MMDDKKHKLEFRVSDAKVRMFDNGEMVKSGKVISISEVLEYLGIQFEIKFED